MPDLSFVVLGAEAVPYAATPMLALKLRVTNADPEECIHSIALQAQIQIEATRRPYGSNEEPRLLDLFGERERWNQTLRTMLWTLTTANVRGFTGATTVDILVPCTFDFNVASTKYFGALESGDIPLALLFSGTAFYEAGERGLQIAQIPWSKEARFRLPVKVWKEVIELYYPNTVWLTLRRDVFDRLHEFKMRNGIATWEQAMDTLLAEAGKVLA
jgi:hypothetical protein